MTDGKHGSASDDLWEQVLSRENMLRAWKRVKANGGAPGSDGMTIAACPAFARQHWERIRSSLMAGTYHPALNNAWLREQGVPDLKAQWIQLHYGRRNPNWDPASVNLTGTAGGGPAGQACPAEAGAKADGVGAGRSILPALEFRHSGEHSNLTIRLP